MSTTATPDKLEVAHEEADAFFGELVEQVAAMYPGHMQEIKARFAHGAVNVVVRELSRIADALDELVRQGRDKASG